MPLPHNLRLLSLSVCLIIPGWAFGEGNRQIPGRLMAHPPTINGVLDADEWNEAEHSSGFIDQSAQAPAKDLTEVWIGYDAKNIYVAAYLHDAHPEQLIARSNQPGAQMEGEDTFQFSVDPLNRRQQQGSSRFIVNPKGTQTERLAGGRASKQEWRGDWKAAAKVVKDGWIVEMAIPWEMLDLPSAKLCDLQVNFLRISQATHSGHQWSDRGLTDLPEKDGVWKGIEVPHLSTKAKIQALVYASPDYDIGASPKFSFHSGVDFRYQPNRQLTGLLSINPDFKNIENAIAGIEFSRSERFVSDARPFFTEGSDYFGLGSGFTYGRLFYSNRIDSFSEGAKFFGNLSPANSVGALVVKGSNARIDSVFKFQHLLGNSSHVSFYGTNRSDSAGSSSSLGSTGTFRFGNYTPGYSLATVTGQQQTRSAVSASLDYNVPRFFTTAQYQVVQPGFNPALGFVEFDDKRGGYSFSSYDTDFKHGRFRGMHAELFAQNYQHFNDTNQEKGINGFFGVLTRQDVFVGAGVGTDRFEDQESFTYNVSATWNSSNPLNQLSIKLNQGQRGGDPTTYFEANGNRRFFDRLDLGISFAKQLYLGRTYQTIATAGYEIDKYRYISARFVQQQGDTNIFLSYRRSGGKGVEYFVIVGDPSALTYRNRVAFKVIWSN